MELIFLFCSLFSLLLSHRYYLIENEYEHSRAKIIAANDFIICGDGGGYKVSILLICFWVKSELIRTEVRMYEQDHIYLEEYIEILYCRSNNKIVILNTGNELDFQSRNLFFVFVFFYILFLLSILL